MIPKLNGIDRLPLRLAGSGLDADVAKILDAPIGACTTLLSVSRVSRTYAQKCN
jgi:hypothetical protein